MVLNNGKDLVNELTGSSTASDLDGLAASAQGLIIVSDGWIEASGRDAILIQDATSAGMTSIAERFVALARARVFAMRDQTQVGGQLLGILAGGEAVGNHQQPGCTQQANALDL